MVIVTFGRESDVRLSQGAAFAVWLMASSARARAVVWRMEGI